MISRYTQIRPSTLRNSVQNGNITVILEGGLEEPFSNYAADGGITTSRSGSLFDDIFADGTTQHFKIEDTNSSQELFTINFIEKIKARNVKIVTHTRLTETFSFRLNDDANLDSGVLQGNTASNTVLSNSVTFNLSNHSNELSKIVFTMEDAAGTTHEFHEIQIFIDDESVPFEFNDSVLSTKAWNSSRYDGRQLQASQINVARKSDIGNNDRTPIIQKYTRNIYIGNTVVGLGNTSAEDGNLVQYENFSYATTNLYITINNDDTITPNRLEDVGNKDTYKKIGFYQSFFDDFPIGSNTKIILGDPTVSDQLKPQYPIYFNGGQLQKLFCLTQGITNHGNAAAGFIYTSGSGTSAQPITDSKRVINLFTEGFDGNQGILGFGINFLNDNLVRNFYTGSIQISGQIGRPNSEITDDDMDAFFTRYFNYQTEALYKGDKRLFATMVSGSSNFQGTDPTFFPLITNVADNLTSSISLNELPIDLSYLSTAEVESHLVGTSDFSNGSLSHDTFKLILSDKNTLVQDYQNLQNQSPTRTAGQIVFGQGDITPRSPIAGSSRRNGFTSGSILFSQPNDNVPSVLIPLAKTSELPDGIGGKPFILIPENLHPHIKDNLIFYLGKAGINIGDDTSVVVEEQTTKKSPIRPKLSPTERAARLAAWQAEVRRNELPKTKRKRRRQERKEDRIEDRQERREDRQERRRERRRNRRRRR